MHQKLFYTFLTILQRPSHSTSPLSSRFCCLNSWLVHCIRDGQLSTRGIYVLKSVWGCPLCKLFLWDPISDLCKERQGSKSTRENSERLGRQSLFVPSPPYGVYQFREKNLSAIGWARAVLTLRRNNSQE